MAGQLPSRRDWLNKMIDIRHEKEGLYTCINCCGIETVGNMSDREAVWKHLSDYHGWPTEKSLLSIQET